jgi:hypothetical protein
MTLDQDIAFFSEYNTNCTAINTRVNAFLNLLDTQVNASNHLFVRRSGAWAVEGITAYNGLYQDFGNVSGSVVLEMNNSTSLSGIMFTAVGEVLIDGFGSNFLAGYPYTFFIKQNSVGGHKVRWPIMTSVLGTINEDPNAITVSTFIKLPDGKLCVKNNAYLPNDNKGYYEFRVVDDYVEVSKSNPTVTGNVFSNDWGSGAYVIAIDADPLNVGEEVIGSEGGIFVVNSDGSWVFTLGTDFEHLTGAESLTSGVTYTATNGVETLTANLRVLVRGAWFPEDEVDMLQHLDAADSETIILSAGKITQWRDKSGKSEHVTQTTASAMPVILPADLNGKDVVSFDGNDNLAGIAWMTERPHWIFYVAKASTNLANCGQTTSGVCLYYGNPGAITSAGHDGVGEQIGLNGFAAHQHRTNVICNLLYSLPAGFSGYNIIGYRWDTRQISGYLNGVLATTGLTANQTAHFWMNIGAGAYGAFTGQVAERIYTNGLLTQNIIDKIIGYLAHKWGLAGKLEETHPYKYIIP